MSKPVIEDFATILTKENMGPLFDTVWDALEAAKTPEAARDALSVYSKDETYTQEETDALVTSKVERDGDTMLGPLTLQAIDPTLDNHAARKAYVDSRVDEVTNTILKADPGWWKDEKTGFMVQWGASSAGTITFPVAFTTGPWIGLGPTGGGSIAYISSRTPTQFVLANSGAFWVAVGY